MNKSRHIVLSGILMTIPLIASGVASGDDPTQFRYDITDIGTLGGLSSVALDINEIGQVVGGADVPDGKRHAYLWENGVMTDLGTFGSSQSEAWGINIHGQVVGLASGTGGLGIAFLWDDGEFTELNNRTGLGTLIPAEATAINDNEQIVGKTAFPSAEQHAFLWEDGVLNDLGTLGGNFPHSIAWDINESSQVTGVSSTNEEPPGGAFLWENDVMTNLGTLGGPLSKGFGINDLGHVVGKAHTLPDNKFFQAFLWKDGIMIDLAALGNFFSDSSSAHDINNQGQIILKGNYRELLYDPNWGFLDLEKMLSPDSGWTELSARAINNKSQIVGVGTFQGFRHAFLMTSIPPIPTVSQWGLIVTAALLLVMGIKIIVRRDLIPPAAQFC